MRAPAPLDPIVQQNALRVRYFPAWRSLTMADHSSEDDRSPTSAEAEQQAPRVHVNRHGSITIEGGHIEAAAHRRPVTYDPLSPSVSELYPGRRTRGVAAASAADTRVSSPADARWPDRMHVDELLSGGAGRGAGDSPSADGLERALFSEEAFDRAAAAPSSLFGDASASVNEIMRRTLAADDLALDPLTDEEEEETRGILGASDMSLLESELRRTHAKQDRLQHLLHLPSAVAGGTEQQLIEAEDLEATVMMNGAQRAPRLTLEERRPDLFRLAGMAPSMPPPASRPPRAEQRHQRRPQQQPQQPAVHVTRTGSVYVDRGSRTGRRERREQSPRSKRSRRSRSPKPRPSPRSRSPININAEEGEFGGGFDEQRTVRKPTRPRTDLSGAATALEELSARREVQRPEGLFTPPQYRARSDSSGTDSALMPVWATATTPMRQRSSPKTLAARADARRRAREGEKRRMGGNGGGETPQQRFVERLESTSSSSSAAVVATLSTAAAPPSAFWDPEVVGTRGGEKEPLALTEARRAKAAVVRRVGATNTVRRKDESNEQKARRKRQQTKEAEFEIHLTESQQVFWERTERSTPREQEREQEREWEREREHVSERRVEEPASSIPIPPGVREGELAKSEETERRAASEAAAAAAAAAAPTAQKITPPTPPPGITSAAEPAVVEHVAELAPAAAATATAAVTAPLSPQKPQPQLPAQEEALDAINAAANESGDDAEKPADIPEAVPEAVVPEAVSVNKTTAAAPSASNPLSRTAGFNAASSSSSSAVADGERANLAATTSAIPRLGVKHAVWEIAADLPSSPSTEEGGGDDGDGGGGDGGDAATRELLWLRAENDRMRREAKAEIMRVRSRARARAASLKAQLNRATNAVLEGKEKPTSSTAKTTKKKKKQKQKRTTLTTTRQQREKKKKNARRGSGGDEREEEKTPARAAATRRGTQRQRRAQAKAEAEAEAEAQAQASASPSVSEDDSDDCVVVAARAVSPVREPTLRDKVAERLRQRRLREKKKKHDSQEELRGARTSFAVKKMVNGGGGAAASASSSASRVESSKVVHAVHESHSQSNSNSKSQQLRAAPPAPRFRPGVSRIPVAEEKEEGERGGAAAHAGGEEESEAMSAFPKHRRGDRSAPAPLGSLFAAHDQQDRDYVEATAGAAAILGSARRDFAEQKIVAQAEADAEADRLYLEARERENKEQRRVERAQRISRLSRPVRRGKDKTAAAAEEPAVAPPFISKVVRPVVTPTVDTSAVLVGALRSQLQTLTAELDRAHDQHAIALSCLEHENIAVMCDYDAARTFAETTEREASASNAASTQHIGKLSSALGTAQRECNELGQQLHDEKSSHGRDVETMQLRIQGLGANLSEMERVYAITTESTAKTQAAEVAQLNIRVAERDAKIEIALNDYRTQSETLRMEKKAVQESQEHAAQVEAQLQKVTKEYSDLYSQANAALRAALEVDGSIDAVERSPDHSAGDFVGKVLGPPPLLVTENSSQSHAARGMGIIGTVSSSTAAAELRIKLLKQSHRLEQVIAEGAHAEALFVTKLAAASAVSEELSEALAAARQETKDLEQRAAREKQDAERVLRDAALDSARQITTLRVELESRGREKVLREEHAKQAGEMAEHSMLRLEEQMREMERRVAAKELEFEKGVAEYETSAAAQTLAAAEANAGLREELTELRAELRAADQDARTKAANLAELENARVALRASLAAEQHRALRAEELHASQIEQTSAAKSVVTATSEQAKSDALRYAQETEELRRLLLGKEEEAQLKLAFALQEQQRRFVAEVEANNEAQMRDFEAIVGTLRERLSASNDLTIQLQSELSAANDRVDAIAKRAESADLALEEQRRSNEEYITKALNVQLHESEERLALRDANVAELRRELLRQKEEQFSVQRGYDAVLLKEQAAAKELRAIHEQAAKMAGGHVPTMAAPRVVEPLSLALLPSGVGSVMEEEDADLEARAHTAAAAAARGAANVGTGFDVDAEGSAGATAGGAADLAQIADATGETGATVSGGGGGAGSESESANAVWGLMAEHSRMRMSKLMEVGVDALAKALNEQDTVAEEQTRAELDAFKARRQVAMRTSRERLAAAIGSGNSASGIGAAAASGGGRAVRISRHGSVFIGERTYATESKVMDTFDV